MLGVDKRTLKVFRSLSWVINAGFSFTSGEENRKSSDFQKIDVLRNFS